LLAGPLVMGLVLMVDPWARNIDFSGGAAVELRGGWAPPRPGDASVETLRVTVSPQGTMTYRDRARGRQLSLDVMPQVFFSTFPDKRVYTQIPARPLFFGQGSLRYSAELGRRWSFQGTAGASIGEQDYSLQSGGLVQGDGTLDPTAPAQGTLVDDPIILTGGISAGVGLTGRLTPLHTISFGPTVTIQRRLDDAEAGGMNGMDAGPPLLVFDQTSVALDVSHAWLASRVDTLGTTLSGGYADFGVNGSQGFGSTSLSWRRRLRPRLDSQVLGGVFFTKQVRERAFDDTSVVETRAVPVMPIANLGVTGRLLERSRVRLSGEVNAGSLAYFDPVQGSVLPLTGGGATFDVYLPPDLNVGLAATFYTPPTEPTEFERSNADNPATARTVLTVRTPVTYDVDRNLTIEVGTITSARGPSLRTDIPTARDPMTMEPLERGPWRFTQAEFWLYVAVRLRYTTEKAERG
jgi:hypothetical protein